MSGSGGEIFLPVPWATRSESSFLISLEDLDEVLKGASFTIDTLEDTSEAALAWRRSQPTAAGLAPSALGLHIVMGEQFALMQANQVRNLEQGRVTFVRGAVSKPKAAAHAA
jgi:hypothetical protein